MGEYKLDENSFHELEPRDQALCLLSMLFMEAKGMTLDDLADEIEYEKSRERYQ